MGGIGMAPYATAQFTTFDLAAYTEQAVVGTNTLALAYGSESVTATRSELGLRTDRSFAMADGILTLRGRAAWAHEFNTDRIIGATYDASAFDLNLWSKAKVRTLPILTDLECWPRLAL